MKYRVGIDVGERSVGFAAIRFDDADMPVEVLAAVSHIHDGGMDPDTAKSPQSRLATSGVARRTRRLVRNRRKRLARLDDVLREVGLPVADAEVPQTYEAWHARARLVDGIVDEEAERNELLVLAIRHIARHRGWRNPWWSYARLAEAESPTTNLEDIIAKSGANLGVDATLGQVVSAVINKSVLVRPTKRALAQADSGLVISTQVRQEDSLEEVRRILSMQRIEAKTVERILEAVFFQAAPRIPKDRVGKCALLPNELRAPSAALEFQEYRIRTAVANLRIKEGRDKRLLVPEEHDLVVKHLMEWRDEERPRWIDVADLLGVALRSLAIPSIDETGTTQAPFDDTSRSIEKAFSKRSEIGVWWRNAAPAERSEFVLVITDLSREENEAENPEVARFLAEMTAESQQKLESLKLASGRAAYSREALRRLNEQMLLERCDVYEARRVAFGVDEDWQPPRPAFSDPIEHPTVARVNTLVRRFLSTAVLRWGVPEEVIVEHVRDAFFGPTALAEHRREVNANTRRREQTRLALNEQGIERPSDTDVRRNECIERQNCVCLYCGSTITLLTSELDHIVPRAKGGSGRRDNLVAVCRECNADKGREPFIVFAERANRLGVGLKEAQDRVREWQRLPGMRPSQLAALKRDVARRLALREDEDLDERSMESTAYAAREMRFRVQSFLNSEASRAGLESMPRVSVYRGWITSEARKAGGVDSMLQLRAATRKSRFDRRHHAIDAAVMTTLRPGIAKTLKERSDIHHDNRDTGSRPEWKEYRGAHPGDQEAFEAWKEGITRLGGLLSAERDADRIAVVRPLRLSPRVGSLHADTVVPLEHKTITDAFTSDEVRRVCDPRLFEALSIEIGDTAELVADANRAAAYAWDAIKPVLLFPSNAPYLQVRGGAVSIGGSARYARIYAWPANNGFRYGWIRVFVGEFGKIGFLKPGIDVLTEPLPAHSQAIRCADPQLVRRVQSGEARAIGWIGLDDELEINTEHFSEGDSKIARFLREAPETHWVVTGFLSGIQVSVAPSLLALEGAGEDTPEIVKEVLASNRILLAVNVLFASPGCKIIRRTVLGRPRWKSDGLPVSWTLREAAERAFEACLPTGV